MDIADILLRAVQRGRERHSPPVVNQALFRWPIPAPSPPGLVVEELEYYVEEGPQGWVPLRIVRPLDEHDKMAPQASEQLAEPAEPSEPAPESRSEAPAPPQPPPAPPPSERAAEDDLEEAAEGDPASEQPGTSPVRRPVVVFMHATGENMDVVRCKQELYARMGYFTAAIDARYHGQRAAIPYEVCTALNAEAPKIVSPAAAVVAVEAAAPEGARGTAAALVATVKGLTPKALAALERADIAAGLKPPPAAVPTTSTATDSATLSPPTLTRTTTRAPAGSRTAAAEARDEAEARERALAHERYVQAWLEAVKEFRERRSAEATTAVLATAPPPPPPAPLPAPVSALSEDGGSTPATAQPPPRPVPTQAHRGAAVARRDKVIARNVYELALAAAWRGSGEQPLFLDTVWDLVLLLDVLALRPEVDMTRFGMTGFSMGGTITWLLTVIDPRVSVSAPVSGVQGFGWAVDNEKYHARVGRYPLVFEIAASDLRATKIAEIDGEVVTAVWNRLLPDLLSTYDAHLSLPTISPRPLLIATGELDQSCPLLGVEQAVDGTSAIYLAWATEQRRLQLEAEAEIVAQAAAEAAAAEVTAAAAAAAAAASGNLEYGLQGRCSLAASASGASLDARMKSRSRYNTPEETASRNMTAAGDGDSSAAGTEAALIEEPRELQTLEAAAAEMGQSAMLAVAAAMLEEDAIVAAAEAAAAAAAAVAAAAAAAAAATAARAKALAEAAEHQRREQMAIEGLLSSRFQFIAVHGVGHTETETMQRAVEQWMHQHLKEPWMRVRLAAKNAGCDDRQ